MRAAAGKGYFSYQTALWAKIHPLVQHSSCKSASFPTLSEVEFRDTLYKAVLNHGALTSYNMSLASGSSVWQRS